MAPGLAVIQGTIVPTGTLRRIDWVLPETLPFGDATIKPLRGGETLRWRVN
jgi:dihydroorotase